MKILILGPFSDKYSTMHGLAEGLEECGHEWEFVETKPGFGSPNVRSPAFARHVATKAEGFDTVLIGKGSSIPLDTYREMVNRCHDTTYLTFDSVSGNGCGPKLRPREVGPRGRICDRIILTGTEGARWFRNHGYGGRLAQIYQGCRPRLWHPQDRPRTCQNRISFLGSGNYEGDGGRRAKFKAIVAAGYNMYQSRRVFHEDAARVYWDSAICPNFVCGDITSNRVVRVLSSGGFCLTEKNADVLHSFQDGVELAMFNFQDIKQMLERIQYFMERPQLREEIAMRGHEWSKTRTWAHQADKMIRFIAGEDIPADGAAAEYVSYQENKDPTD